jgi:UDP-N-acetylmuramoylalanine--D-glutamate ligase
MDHHPASENLRSLEDIAPGTGVSALVRDELCAAEEIVISPGVPLSTPEIQAAVRAGVHVTGDIAMFGDLATAPVIGITGSNGKSTVTALVGEMAQNAGVDVAVGGNIGTPCLDLLEESRELFVLEISSYQLEVVDNPSYRVACLLNLSPDHLDRYKSVDDYYGAKARIFGGCDTAVISRTIDHPLDMSKVDHTVTFGPDVAEDGHFGLLTSGDAVYLAEGDKPLLSVSELPIRGGHNYQNALAALAIGSSLDWEYDAMLDALREFRGLPHRCEIVGEFGGMTWINDSKSTNVASTLAALKGIGPEHPGLVLILGGQGKGADFSLLSGDIKRHAARTYVYGADRDAIADQLDCPVFVRRALDEVIADLASTTEAGKVVLFSPGCASLDQFTNFEVRGEYFRALVSELTT